MTTTCRRCVAIGLLQSFCFLDDFDDSAEGHYR
jgi:hypothetical protein